MQRTRRNPDVLAEEVLPPLQFTYFTDPLCCWSWGMQPHLEALQEHYGHLLTIDYVMGGLLPSWKRFHDGVNSVSRPAQMGPVWMHAAQLTGRPIHHHVWIKDPPASSYPACIAVKCAALQSPAAGIAFYKRLQQAVMMGGRNIALWPVIYALAGEMEAAFPSFSCEQFAADYNGEEGLNAFKADLALAASLQVVRFPTLLVEAAGQQRILIPGYSTGERVIRTVEQVFPGFRQAE